MVDLRWAEDVATGLLMRPNRSKQLSRSGCVLRRARVCHLTLLTSITSLPVATNPHMLKRTTMTVQQHIRSLEAMGFNINDNETSLLAVTKPKFKNFIDKLLFLNKRALFSTSNRRTDQRYHQQSEICHRDRNQIRPMSSNHSSGSFGSNKLYILSREALER